MDLIQGKTELGYGDRGLLLKADGFDGSIHVFSVAVIDGYVTFREECDGFYKATMSTEKALNLLDEIKKYIMESKNSHDLGEHEFIGVFIDESSITTEIKVYAINMLQAFVDLHKIGTKFNTKLTSVKHGKGLITCVDEIKESGMLIF